MKKRQVDHVLRSAGRITGEKQFVIVGSQALHGKFPDLADEIVRSAEVDLIAKKNVARTDWLNAIGQDSSFHEQFGYYADPVDENTAILPRGWRGRLVNLPPGRYGRRYRPVLGSTRLGDRQVRSGTRKGCGLQS
jgi:hypothetical protein